MPTIIRIDQRTKSAQMLIAYMQTLPFVQMEGGNRKFNRKTEKAMKEARKGIGVVNSKSHSDLMKNLKS
jgi:hypothetical protein